LGRALARHARGRLILDLLVDFVENASTNRCLGIKLLGAFLIPLVPADVELVAFDLIDGEQLRPPLLASGNLDIESLRGGLRAASRLLTESEPRVTGPDAYRDYAPLRVAELFKRLAEVQETQDGIGGFANRFGLLGDTRLASRDRSAEMSALITGEDIDLWRGAIQRMKQALQLWELIRAEDNQELGRLLKKVRLPYAPGPLVSGTPFPYGSGGGFPGETPNPRIDMTDILTAARLLLGVWMGHSLQRQVSPRPLWDPQEERYVIRILPLTLQGAIWWQFARAVAGEIQFRKCKVCGELIEIAVGGAGGGHRSHTEFCSGKCRQKDHRNKMKQAHEMKARGKTDREIARYFKTRIDSIKRWLTPRERSKGKAS
jgi:hypothetical protein